MKQYFYCDGLTMLSTTVSLGTISTCLITYNWQQGQFYNRVYSHTVTATIPSPLPVDLTVRMTDEIYDCPAFQDCFTYTQNYNITILAGQTSGSVVRTCKTESYEDFGSGGQEYSSSEVTDVFVADQPSLPVGCELEEPLDCDLTITDVVVTNPTQRGFNNGSIAVTISGATGSTITYKINGVTRTTTGSASGYTYTGLGGGTYEIFIQEEDCFAFQSNISVLDGEFRTGDFVTSNINNLTAAHNPVVLNVGTARTKIVVDEGLRFKIIYPSPEKASMLFKVQDVHIEDGYQIVFAFTKPIIYNQTFFAKTFPNRSNFFLASDITDINNNVQGSNSYLEIAQSLAESLQKDVFISQNYSVKVSGDEVLVRARQDGSKFDLDSNNVFIRNAAGDDVITGITKTIITLGVDEFDGQIVDNYSIYAEVYVNNDITIQYPSSGQTIAYDKVAELTIPFQSNNIHLFNLSDVLKNYVSTAKPFYDFTGYTTQPLFMRPFYLKLGETYPIVSNSNTIKKRFKTQTGVRWTMNSALDYFTANNMSLYVGNNRKFLTNSPAVKHIQRQQNEYLYFLIENNFEYSTALYGDIYFYDATSIEDYKFFDIKSSGDTTGGVVMLNLSYDKLGLEDIEYSGSTVRKIKYVDVHVDYNISGGTWTGLTETKRYAFNINEQPRKFGVLFQNKLGTYDTFDFIGIKETLLNRTYDEYTVSTLPNQEGALQQGFKHKAMYNTRVTKRVTANTGYINKEHLNWLQELLMSNNIYDYTETNQNYLKVIDHKYIESSQDDVFDMEVTFEYSIFENNVSI
jgi:hypothetical protein